MGDEVKPITPDEARDQIITPIPGGVIAAFNEMIGNNFRNGEATFTQKEVVSLICINMSVKSQKIYEQKWLDVEGLFEKMGWTVTYDKPGYNETYEATFTFKERHKR